MIPYGILSGKILFNDRTYLDIRVLDLSLDGFTFRIPKKYKPDKNVQAFSLNFFQFSMAKYFPLNITVFHLSLEERAEFFLVYRVIVENPQYKQLTQKLMQEYMQYINLKLTGDDAELSSVLVGYEKEKETDFPTSVQDWKNQLFKKTKEQFLSVHKAGLDQLFLAASIPETAIELLSEKQIQSFMELDFSAFLETYWKNQGMEWHPFSKLSVSCIYIGNQYCFHLFPEQKVLQKLLERVLELHLTPVLAFPPIQEQHFSKIVSIIDFLAEWYTLHRTSFSGKKLELILNDWGMIHFLSNYPYSDSFSLSIGILLNKRRKDSRLSYKNDVEKQTFLLKENNSNASFYREYLEKEYGIFRFSFESCGYPLALPEGKHILHLPFYQMNTSGHCTLFAACHNGNRAKQTTVCSCPHYCHEFAFLYPTFLSMAGIGNSLFGYDDTFLIAPEKINEFYSDKLMRIVFSFI